MTVIKIIGFTLAAGALPVAQQNLIGSGLDDTARAIEKASPVYVLSLISILFAWTIFSLFKLLVKTNERHHEEWAEREEALAAEREIRHRQMLEMGEKMTEAMTGVKTVVEKCRRGDIHR